MLIIGDGCICRQELLEFESRDQFLWSTVIRMPMFYEQALGFIHLLGSGKKTEYGRWKLGGRRFCAHSHIDSEWFWVRVAPLPTTTTYNTTDLTPWLSMSAGWAGRAAGDVIWLLIVRHVWSHQTGWGNCGCFMVDAPTDRKMLKRLTGPHRALSEGSQGGRNHSYLSYTL